MKGKGILFIVSAPSGAGKTTIAAKIVKTIEGINTSISHTTRKPRKNEVNGKDYLFVSEKTFKEMVKNNEFIEWAEVFGNFYGTSISNINIVEKEKKDLLLVIDVQGAEQLRKRQQNGCYIFILPPSIKVLETRLRSRGADPEEDISKRISTASEEISHYRSYDYIIINKDLDDAVLQLKSIIFAERCRYPNFIPKLPDLKL